MLKIKTYFCGQEVDPRITLSLRSSSLPSCLVVSSLSLSEAKRLFETEFDHCFFAFPLFLFWRLWRTSFCVVIRFFVFVEFWFWVWGGIGRGNGKFRNCNIILGRSLFFFAFDLKVLIDSPLSFFQFFVVSCAGLRAFKPIHMIYFCLLFQTARHSCVNSLF